MEGRVVEALEQIAAAHPGQWELFSFSYQTLKPSVM
jgi:hypothetical protein